jgi:hypothetical protein
VAFANVQDTADTMRLKHECAPSTPAESIHAVHVTSGHAAKQPPLPALENGADAGHSVQLPALLALYLPAPHITAVLLVDRKGHAYPTLQLPEQLALPRPGVLPYTPAGQSEQALHPDSEYRPTGHSVQLLAPPALQVPEAHGVPVALVDPAGHALPPGAEQLPAHTGVVSPEVLPKAPGGHSMQPPTAPPTLYDPGGHCRQPVVKLGPRYCPGAHTSISQMYDAVKTGVPDPKMSFMSVLAMCALFSARPP